MADVILKGARFADEEQPELVLHQVRVQLEAIAGGSVDAETGEATPAELGGFWFVVTELDAETGEPMPRSVRVRFPSDVPTAKLLAASILDYLDKHEQKTRIHVPELHAIPRSRRR